MEKAKHTPGPWSASWRDYGGVIDKNGYVVAQAATYTNKEVIDANTSLISAAPELLEAAYKTMEWWEEHQYDTTGDHGEWNLFDSEPAFVSQARAAIAKATGSIK